MNRELSLYRAARRLTLRNCTDDALRLIRRHERRHELSAQLLVFKARLIQLSDNAGYTLKDVVPALRLATRVDPRYIQAWLELGWYYFLVDGSTRLAARYFRTAASLATEDLHEALEGDLGCIAELQSRGAAMQSLGRIRKMLVDVPRLKRAIKEVIVAGDERPRSRRSTRTRPRNPVVESRRPRGAQAKTRNA